MDGQASRTGTSKAGAFRVETLVVGPISTNCYIVWRDGSDEAAVIDPGGGLNSIVDALSKNHLRCVAIVNTHGHPDHIAANGGLRSATGARVYVGAADAAMLSDPEDMFHVIARSAGGSDDLGADATVAGGDKLKAGSVEFEVLATPGHTPGGISLWLPGDLVVFTGDTLFADGGVGRTDFRGGDDRALADSMGRVLFSLPNEAVVYPGHGPATTIGREKRNHGRMG
ncbi:MAG: MBL fold metallo-hydrolase [Firmicutes bacterium]|nr:MBL fold metallo-hydrolase [Bacillota bacterium]